MSYFFTILSPTDVPLFSLTFGTSKAGGDGVARFRLPDASRYMNQFIVHASLDIVEEVQWSNGAMYLKQIDTYPPTASYVSAFLTGSGARFLLLHQPPQPPTSSTSGGGGNPASSINSLTASTASMSLSGSSSASTIAPTTSSSSRASSTSIANNPTSPQTEEAIRQFMNEVYESWVKTVMSPFYRHGMEIRSPVFRARVVAAGKKWL